MTGLLPEEQAGIWQLISVGVNRGTSASVAMIVKRSVKPECARTHLPVIFALHETRSWGVRNLELLGYLCYGGKLGLATLAVSDRFFQNTEIFEV